MRVEGFASSGQDKGRLDDFPAQVNVVKVFQAVYAVSQLPEIWSHARRGEPLQSLPTLPINGSSQEEHCDWAIACDKSSSCMS